MRTVPLVLVVAVAAAAAPAAAAPAARHCAAVPSAGVSHLVTQGVGCAPARTVARRWATWARRAAHRSRGHVVNGYLCRKRSHAVRCSTKTALIRFTWRA